MAERIMKVVVMVKRLVDGESELLFDMTTTKLYNSSYHSNTHHHYLVIYDSRVIGVIEYIWGGGYSKEWIGVIEKIQDD